VGDTKEVSLLKRKVFASNPSSYVNDVRAAINDDQAPPPRAAKRRAQETLGVVHEDDEAYDDRAKAKGVAPKRRKTIEKESKPGYCENCRDKYDDFDDVSLLLRHASKTLTLTLTMCSMFSPASTANSHWHMRTGRSSMPFSDSSNALTRRSVDHTTYTNTH
jgi:hypothetical protein